MEKESILEFLPQSVQSRIHANTGRTFDVTNPANGHVIASVADNGEREARTAADAAVDGFLKWKTATAYERAAVLRRWFNLIVEHENNLARLISLEMGKPVAEARGEVRYAAGFVEWYSEESKRIYGDTVPATAAHKRLFAIKQPVGPVYAITPWNFPAA